jgi:hypothetical protein
MRIHSGTEEPVVSRLGFSADVSRMEVRLLDYSCAKPFANVCVGGCEFLSDEN